MLHVAAGAAFYLLADGLPSPNPLAEDAIAERLTEFVVIVSLTAAGLKLDRRPSWRGWQPTWRLLIVAMPLTIAATALLGWAAVGLAPASALLLGAVIAPTDPVLASDVQVAGPNAGEESDVRVALTAEAGLNDALAFPFVNAAIAIAIAGGGAWFWSWALEDVVVKLAVGLLVGYAGGRSLGWLAFRGPTTTQLARTREGIAAVGATLLVYSVTEVAHGYGFLAVFVAAVTLRDHEREHEFHEELHDSTELVERLGSALVLLLVGGAVAEGGLRGMGWPEALVAVAVVVVVRPLFGWISLSRTGLERIPRLVIAGFGIRGMGSIYYLAHATTEAKFSGRQALWSIVLLTILLSVVLHGATSYRAMRRAETAASAPTGSLREP
jgi:NhaP-type Na+/H+ or K+/H+ antiporter